MEWNENLGSQTYRVRVVNDIADPHPPCLQEHDHGDDRPDDG